MFQKIFKNGALAKKFSTVSHPQHGKLYGPFLYSFVDNNFEKIKKNWRFHQIPGSNNKLIAYFPNLSSNEDFKVILDFVTRKDVNNTSVIFFSKHEPNIEHEQFVGKEVFWMLDKLPDGTLSAHPAIINNKGKITIGDPNLEKSLRSMLTATMDQTMNLQAKTFYQRYLNGVFKELEESNQSDQEQTSSFPNGQ